jgi:UDP-N-acetylglucosamine transferase subunit ALG13
MILVTLGTQDKPFVRLLKAIDDEIIKGNIKEKVIVQAGYSLNKYETNNMEMFDLIDRESFNKLVNECSLLITHGGVGSILAGLKANKKVIACPRLFKYKEHINDHQTQIINEFAKVGYILAYNENDKLEDILKKAKTFKPQKYVSNTNNLVEMIKDFIDNN